MKRWIETIRKQPGFVMAVNFLLLMAIYMLSRWVFFYMNKSSFPDVTFEDKKGHRKKGKGFVFKIDDDVMSIPFNKIDQTMLYSSVLIASVYGIKLKRYDFTEYCL